MSALSMGSNFVMRSNMGMVYPMCMEFTMGMVYTMCMEFSMGMVFTMGTRSAIAMGSAEWSMTIIRDYVML